MKFDPVSVGIETDGMSFEEIGAYFTVVRHLWQRGALGEDHVRRVVKSNFEVIRAVMIEVDGLLSFEWVEEARSNGNKRTDSASKAGIASALARTSKPKKRQRPFNDRSTNAEQPLNEGSTGVLSMSMSSSSSESSSLTQGRKERAPAKTLFAQSRYTNIELVREALPELVAEGVNLEHYLDAISNWSDTKDERRSDRGWLATFRQWAKTDRDKGELKKAGAPANGKPAWNPRG